MVGLFNTCKGVRHLQDKLRGKSNTTRLSIIMAIKTSSLDQGLRRITTVRINQVEDQYGARQRRKIE